MNLSPSPRVVVLSGGFGGARFVPGLIAAAAGDALVVTNPGDDLRYLGAEVWPDFDSVLYALAGVFDEGQGWGRRDDTTGVFDEVGDEAWFRMGDRDLALSLLRTAWLDEGLDRAEIARRCCERLGVATPVLPAALKPHRTRVHTDGGTFGLQEYLVARRASDRPLRITIDPATQAAPAAVTEAIAGAELVVLGPSSPILSLVPIVAVPGVADALAAASRVVAVSPVISSVAPALPPEIGRYRVRERLLEAYDVAHTAAAVARFWGGLVDGWVVDAGDQACVDHMRAAGLAVSTTRLLRTGAQEREALGREVIAFGLRLGPRARAQRSPAADEARRLGGVVL